MKWKQAAAVLGAAFLCTLASAGSVSAGETLLHLPFNEGEGTLVSDASGHLANAEIQYQYLHAVYTEDMELFLDRSLVEGYFNKDKSLSIRAYGKKKSRQMFFFAEGEVEIESLEVHEVDSIY